jgi:hypothetical protein
MQDYRVIVQNVCLCSLPKEGSSTQGNPEVQGSADTDRNGRNPPHTGNAVWT